MNQNVIDEARENIKYLEMEDKIQVRLMDAMDLDFEDESMDLIINEAMLTLHKNQDKKRALKEYHRVLRPGGRLLTHDVFIGKDDNNQRQNLSRNIHMTVYPQTMEIWEDLIRESGFVNIQVKTGPMALLDIETMIKDEGPIRAAQIIKNGYKEENRERFIKMRENL